MPCEYEITVFVTAYLICLYYQRQLHLMIF